MQALSPAVWCLIAAFLFGASTPAAKLLLTATGPVLLSGLLYFGAALAVAPSASRRWRLLRVADSANLARLFGAVVLGGIVGPLLLLWGLSMAQAASVSLWLTMETVATALCARFLFREHLGWRGVLAMVLVVAASLGLAEYQTGMHRAVIFVGLACVAWGLDNSLTARIDAFTTAQITFVKGLGAAIVAIPAGLLLGGQASVLHVFAALVIGALGYGLSLVLYVAAAQQLGALRSQLWFSTAPLFGLFVAWVLVGETLTLAHAGAVLCMAIALWILLHEKHVHEHEHEALEHMHWHRHDDDHHAHEPNDSQASQKWSQHRHQHERLLHSHPHNPDLHHRHTHS